jgi:LEA14-like dessication related protein
MKAKTIKTIIAVASIAILFSGCSGSDERIKQEKLRQDISVVESEESQFVQTGYTKIYNAQGSDTQLITLYDKKTGVEYIMLRNSDMTSLQPRTASDGGILLHKASDKGE